jgi:hypothetical protein
MFLLQFYFSNLLLKVIDYLLKKGKRMLLFSTIILNHFKIYFLSQFLIVGFFSWNFFNYLRLGFS